MSSHFSKESVGALHTKDKRVSRQQARVICFWSEVDSRLREKEAGRKRELCGGREEDRKELKMKEDDVACEVSEEMMKEFDWEPQGFYDLFRFFLSLS